MLKQPYNFISKDNKDYIVNLVKFVDDSYRAGIDPRLWKLFYLEKLIN